MTLVERVTHERRRLRALLLLEGALLVLAVVGLALAAGVAALGGDRWLTLPTMVPWLVWALVLGAGAIALDLTRRRLRREAATPSVASAIERDLGLRTGALRVALEVREHGALGRRAAADVGERLGPEHRALAPSLRRGLSRRLQLAAATVLVAVGALAAAGFTTGDGWAPIAHPLDAARGRLLPRMRVDAPPWVVRGEALTLRIEAPRRRGVVVHTRARGAGWRDSVLALPPGGLGELRLPRADADLLAVISDSRSSSDTAHVRVVERPFVGDVALEARYPAYLGRAAEPLAVGELARLPQGTVIAISGRASTMLRRVALVRAGDTTTLAADGHRFTGRLAPRGSGRWTWQADGSAGTIADLPAPLDVEIVPDSAPRVELLTPSKDTIVASSDQVRIGVGASDDHGLARVELRTTRRTASGTALPALVQSLAGRAPSPWMGETILDLASRGLEPGDELRVVAVASDETPWGQRGESRELVLKVPSLSEQRVMARAAGDSAVAMAAAAAATQRDLQRRTGDASRSRGDRGRSAQDRGSQNGSARDARSNMDFESAEKARSLAKEQRDLAARVKQLQEQTRKLEQQLRQAGALDSALAQRLQEVQRLLKDAITPEMAARLAELETASQKLQGDQARQAMGDLAQQQQRLKEQLDRSVEMLKRAALEGSMETLRDEAKELAQQQRQLADSLAGKPDDASRQAARDSAAAHDGAKPTGDPQSPAQAKAGPQQRAGADELAARSRELSKELDKLSRKLQQEGAQTGARRVSSASQKASASAEKMAQAARAGKRDGRDQKGAQAAGTQARAGAGQQGGGESSAEQQQGEPQSGAGAAQSAAERMEQAAQDMAAARDQQVDEWKSALAKELDQAILETLQLARQEEQLAQQAQGQGGQGSTRAEQSAVQQGAEKLGERVGKAAQSSSHVSPRSQRAMADAMRKVNDATRESAEQSAGNGQSASNAMRDAASSLNQAAASLVRDRDRLGSAKSASGFAEMMERMQELAKQQGALASQAAGMSLVPGQQRGSQGQQQQPGGNKAGGQQGGNARSLAEGQRKVADGLDDLGDGDGSGRTDEMAAEARRIAQALDRGIVDQSIIDRQQRLFRRMLDAGRSLEQDDREDTGKRESKSALDPQQYSPTGTDAAGRAAQRFRAPDWNELRGLSAEERRVVLEYFKRLNAEQP